MLSNLLAWTTQYHRLLRHSTIILVALSAYGMILWNGAGFSQPDDWFAAGMDGWGTRPLLTLSYWLNRQLGGGWMIVNLGLHMLASVLVFALSGTVWAGLLFAAHPLATDAVASVAGRSSVLCSVFVLGALLALKRGSMIYWLLLGGCAFFVKQEAAALLILSPVCLFALGKRRQAILVTGMMICLAFALWIAWYPFLKESGRVPALTAVGIRPAPGQIQYFRNFASAVGSYVAPRMVIPVNLNSDPDIRYSVKSEVAGWMLLPMVLPLIPYAFAPLPDVFLEHRAYLALAMFCILAASVLRAARLPIVPIVVVLAIGSNQRIHAYADPTRLLEDAVQKSPNKGRPHINLAVVYANQKRYAAAKTQLEAAIRVAPEISLGWTSLVTLHLIQGDMSSASKVLDSQSEYMKKRTRL